MAFPKYKRILLKLSGESLCGESGHGINSDHLLSISREIKLAHDRGVQIGIDFGPIGSTVVAFGLIGIAYDYQVFKGALSAIPRGQFEAGRALALPTVAIYRQILLPQLWPLAKPGWITYAIGTVKRVSIASAVSVSEPIWLTLTSRALADDISMPLLMRSVLVTKWSSPTGRMLSLGTLPSSIVSGPRAPCRTRARTADTSRE